MEERTHKEHLYEQFARIGQALSNSHRLELLDLLSQCERPVETLAREAHLSIANASQHLQVLKEARLVKTRKERQQVFYRLPGDSVVTLLRQLEEVAYQENAEVDRAVKLYLGGLDGLETVDAEELAKRLEEEEITILDVRPVEEYRAGHLPGAVSIPVEQLESRLAELSPDREIIAYCRGPYCVFAPKAVEILRRHGFKARRLREGLPDWRVSGKTVAVGN